MGGLIHFENICFSVLTESVTLLTEKQALLKRNV